MEKKKLETFKKKLETRQQELRRTVIDIAEKLGQSEPVETVTVPDPETE